MRSKLLIAMALVFSCACTRATEAPRNACNAVIKPEPKPPEKPKVPLTAPFAWQIEVKYPDNGERTFTPGSKPQLVPMGDAATPWKCGHMGLIKRVNQGTYLEGRDVACQLPTGEAVAVRTACVRHSDGTVEVDSQYLIVQGPAQHTLVVRCGEAEGNVEADDDEGGEPSRSTPIFNPPRSLSL